MSKISERLECYQTQMSIYAEQHKIILANDVLDMIEQLQEDLEDDIEKVVAELETLRIDKCNYFGVLNVVAEKYDRANEMLDDAIDIVRKGGVE